MRDQFYFGIAMGTMSVFQSLDISYHGNGAGFRTGIKTGAASGASFALVMGGAVTHGIQAIGKIKDVHRAGIDTKTTALAIVNLY
jgi:hypothetical protein